MICKDLICAETIVVDDRTKRVSAINIFDDTLFNNFPAFLSLMVYISVQKENVQNESPAVSLEIKLNDTPIYKNAVNVNFQGTTISRSIVMTGVPITAPGVLKLTVLGNIGGQEVLKEKSFVLSSAKTIEVKPVATSTTPTVA